MKLVTLNTKFADLKHDLKVTSNFVNNFVWEKFYYQEFPTKSK